MKNQAENSRKEKLSMRIDWARKLTSRKMWLSIAEFAAMLLVFFGHAESTATQVAALIMAGAGVIGYVIAEGLTDSANANTGIQLEAEYIEDDEDYIEDEDEEV